MVDSLEDKHSTFQTPSESQKFQESLNQELIGIGVVVSQNENLEFEVISPIEGSPAEEIGLKSGDIITHVNGISITGKSMEDSLELIKGPENTRVKITIRRNNNSLNFNIIRKKINLPLVEMKIVDDINLLIDINSFGLDTFNQLQNLLNSNELDAVENIIIDLRSNPGGYLDSAIYISDLFLEKNAKIAHQVDKNKTIEYKALKEQKIKGKPIYIMVDRGTASASEILAISLKSNLNAKIYGERTYGKGSVQQLISFTDDSALKLTTGLWLGPKMETINEKGISPDVSVKINQYDLDNKNDPVLNKILLDIKAR